MSEQQNAFIKDLCHLMNNPYFKQFKHRYMKEWSDVETLFLYIYMHEYISKEFSDRFAKKISDEQMSHILQLIFNTTELRKKSIELFRQYQNGSTKQNMLNRLPSYVFLTLKK